MFLAAPAQACSLAIRTGWRVFEGRALAHTKQAGDPLPAYDWTFEVTKWDEERTTDPARPPPVVVREPNCGARFRPPLRPPGPVATTRGWTFHSRRVRATTSSPIRPAHQVVRAERVLRPVRTAPPTHLSAAACHGLAAVHMHRSSGSRVRTCDLGINSPALCQLSYPGKDSGQDSRGPNRVVIFGDSPHEPLSGAMPDSSLRRGAVAQWLERGTHNPLVVGSIPTRPTSFTSTNAEIHLHT